MLLHVSGVGLSDNIGLRGPEIAITQSRLSVPYSSQATQPALVRTRSFVLHGCANDSFFQTDIAWWRRPRTTSRKPSDDPAD